MPFRVSGRNIDVGEALRARINARVTDATAKYFDGGFSGHVTIGKEGFGFRTECVIHLDSGIVLEADALAADAYASADQAAIRLEKRLRRYKRRLKDHQATKAALASEASGQRGNYLEVPAPRTRPEAGSPARANGQTADRYETDRTSIDAPSYVIAAHSASKDARERANHSEEEVGEWNPVIIAESTTTLKRLSVSEAVMELDLTGVPV